MPPRTRVFTPSRAGRQTAPNCSQVEASADPQVSLTHSLHLMLKIKITMRREMS